MKKLLFIFTLFFSLVASAQIDKIVPAKPPLSEGLVLDNAGILTPEQEDALEKKLVAYDDSTSNQIVIVTLPTLQDASGNVYEDEEVALKILRDWGVGQKDKNNGIVILIVKSKDDSEKKIRIEVGYGLEGAIPDITAGSIIEDDLKPNFRAGDYYRGLDEATDHLIKAAEGEYKAPEGYSERDLKRGISIGKIILIIIIIIILMSAGGGGRGTYVSRGGYRGWTPWIGGGGWSGGGGGGGWSGGGGGFGGFGGGSGGGGGASGSW